MKTQYVFYILFFQNTEFVFLGRNQFMNNRGVAGLKEGYGQICDEPNGKKEKFLPAVH